MLTKSRLKFLDQTTLVVMFLLVLFFVFFPFLNVQADTFGVGGIGDQIGLAGTDIRIIIANIIRVALGLLGIIAIILVIYAGYTIMTSGGAEDKVASGKKILLNAVIGLAIILSAFAIVTFVITRFYAATGSDLYSRTRSGVGVEWNSFSGSGALGRIVRDHYPARSAKGISRNTKIIVTFNEPIDPRSIVEDRNNNGIFGDCLNWGGNNFSWDGCDRAKPDAVQVSRVDDSTNFISLVAIATYESNGGVLNYVFRPLDLLGDSTGDVKYKVVLTNEIKKGIIGEITEVISAFVGFKDPRYEWTFETGELVDVDPPTIVSTYPVLDDTTNSIPRNTILQVNFSEPMDPSLVQGLTSPTSSFFNILFNTTTITGEWRLTNNYSTLEFVSADTCGFNSCGDVRYCLPVTCPQGVTDCAVPYKVLFRTARLITPGVFESIPGSGIMDLAGNALDGDSDNIADGKPSMPSDLRTMRLSGEAPFEDGADNFFWSINVNNTIDNYIPFIETMEPGVDEEEVLGDADVIVTFNQMMWQATMRGVDIEEHGYESPSGFPPIDPMWKRHRAKNIGLDDDSTDRTEISIEHREFGPNNIDAYYFTSVSSTVRGINQNCMYPGRGPAAVSGSPAPACVRSVDPNNIESFAGCIGVNIQSNTDSGCLHLSFDPNSQTPSFLHTQPNNQICAGLLRDISN